MGVDEDTVCLIAGQKKLMDEYKDPDMLPKIIKSDMARMMEAIKEYLRSCHGVIRTPLAYIIRKTIIVETYGDYPKYTTPDDETLPGCYICHQVRKSSSMRKMLKQPKHVCPNMK